MPEALSGRGIAGEIVKFGLDHAREKKLTVVPQCSYVAAYIKRHPEYQDLLARRPESRRVQVAELKGACRAASPRL